MTLAELVPSWGNFLLTLAETAFAAILSAAGTVMFVARKTFASKDEVAQRFVEHDARHRAIEQRLADGDQRFVRFEAMVNAVSKAAETALKAAEKAADAAEQNQEVRVDIATLHGQIATLEAALEPVKHFNQVLIEGHMRGARS